MHPVYLCDGVRTPIGRYAGALSSMRPDDLAALVIRTLLRKVATLDLCAVDEVVFGCANQAGEDNRNVARMAALLAGLPAEVPGVTVNRLCGSGLDAVIAGARAVMVGDADVVIAGGVESMSRAPFVMAKAGRAFDRMPKLEDSTIGWRFINPAMEDLFGVDSLGITAENVATEYKVDRNSQDAFALRSQQRWSAAHSRGIFDDELVPVEIGGRNSQIISVDEHPRPETDFSTLSRLRPAFQSSGTVTAGNSSGVNDGSCALLLASKDAVDRWGLEPLAKLTGASSAGVAPRVMGIGPVPAVQRLMDRCDLAIQDFDVIELNEAFASQAIAVLRALGLDDDAEHVNPNGGAIAMGHPLGMSGARIALTAALEMRRRGGDRALCAMCVGVGQGVALAMEVAG
ncbi:MAG: 3-oxoadipyl-CoA thiolase [Pseudomonadota bacterium]